MAVKDLVVNPSVFVKNELTITGQVRVDGYVNADIPVRRALRDGAGQDGGRRPADDPRHGRRPAPARSNSAMSREVPGEHKLTLEAVPSRANW